MDSLAWFRPCAGTLPSGRRRYYIPPPCLRGTELSISLVIDTPVTTPEELTRTTSALSEGRQRKLELTLPGLDTVGRFARASRGGGGHSEEITVRYDDLPLSLEAVEVDINIRDVDAELFSASALLDRIDPRTP